MGYIWDSNIPFTISMYNLYFFTMKVSQQLYVYLKYENHLKTDGRIDVIFGSRDISIFQKLQHDATTITTVMTVKIVIWSGFMCSIFFSKELSVYKVSFDYCVSYSWLKKFSIYFNKWTWSCHKFYLFYQSFTKNVRTVSQFLCHLHFFECWYSVCLEPGKMSKTVNCILYTSSYILM